MLKKIHHRFKGQVKRFNFKREINQVENEIGIEIMNSFYITPYCVKFISSQFQNKSHHFFGNKNPI